MKIVGIECIPVTSVFKKVHINAGGVGQGAKSVIVKIYTDEGITGIADSGGTWEWYIGDSQDSIIGVINEIFAQQILIGEDPFNIERIVARMDRAARGNNQAKAVVDIALHDIMGKKLGVPVYQLLGGLSHEKIPLGWVMSSETTEEMVAEAERWLNAGYHSLKVKVAFRSEEEDLQNVKAIREAVGSKARISIDANGGWNYYQALRILEKMQKYDIFIAEQPLPWWDIDGMARLRQKISIPIFPDESAAELKDLLEIVQKNAADGLFLKVMKAGGLLKAQKWVAVAKAAGLPVMCGCMVGAGIEAAAQAHFLAAIEWMGKLEQENVGMLTIHGVTDTVTTPITNDLAKVPPRYENGFLYPPSGPGLGVELNEAVIPQMITQGKKPTMIGKR